jgi:cyanate lyase
MISKCHTSHAIYHGQVLKVKEFRFSVSENKYSKNYSFEEIKKKIGRVSIIIKLAVYLQI